MTTSERMWRGGSHRVDERVDDEAWLRAIAESIAAAVESRSVVACLYGREDDERIEIREHLVVERAEFDATETSRRLVVLRATASEGEGCILGVLLEGARANDELAREIFPRIEAHLAAAYRRRLRSRDAREPSRFRPSDGPSSGEDVPDASVDERGFARIATLLRRGARRLDAIESAALQRSLFARAWSVLDQYERDGRIVVVARVMESSACDIVSLTERERDVISRVAAGQANKCIAFELGVETSTVAQLLLRGLARLGVRERAARAEFFSDVRERLAAQRVSLR